MHSRASMDTGKCMRLSGTGSSAWTSEAMKITPQEVIDVLGGISEVYGDKGVTADIGQILSSNQVHHVLPIDNLSTRWWDV